MKAETILRRLGFGGVALIFIVAAFLWPQIKEIAPSLASWLTVIAATPLAWFILFMFVWALLTFGPKHRPMIAQATSSDTLDFENRLILMESKLNEQAETIRRYGQDIVNRITADRAFEGKIDVLTERTQEHERHLETAITSTHQTQNLILTSLRAQRALTKIAELHLHIRLVADRLTHAKATSYSTGEEWTEDYTEWQRSLDEAYAIISAWDRTAQHPMKINPSDYEQIDDDVVFKDSPLFSKHDMKHRRRTLLIAFHNYLRMHGAFVQVVDSKADF